MSRIKAKMVFDKIVEKKGKCGVSKAMRDVGFSPRYAHNPQQFLKTKTAQELMKEYLPDELIAKKHNELLNAAEIQHYIFPHEPKKKQLSNEEVKEIVESVPGCRLIYVKRDKFSGTTAYFQAPNGKIQKDAVDMAYKLFGSYAAEKIELTKRKYQDLTDEELVAKRKALRDVLLKKKNK
jgi:hypothetical protein